MKPAPSIEKVRCRDCGRWAAVVDRRTLQVLKRRPGVRVETVADETTEQMLAHEEFLRSGDRSSPPPFGAFGTNKVVYITCSCSKRFAISLPSRTAQEHSGNVIDN